MLHKNCKVDDIWQYNSRLDPSNNGVAVEGGGCLTEQIRGRVTWRASSSVLERGGVTTGQRPS